MSVYLSGISARFFRGIGPQRQRIFPFSKMNFFIGANNSGKSIVLNLISDHLPTVKSMPISMVLEGVERYRGAETGNFSCEVTIRTDRVISDLDKLLTQRYSSDLFKSRRPYKLILEILDLISEEGAIWGRFENGSFIPSVLEYDNERSKLDSVDESTWTNIYQYLTNSRQTATNSTQAMVVLFKDSRPEIPKSLLIPAKRRLSEKGVEFKGQSGEGLIDHLATLQNPGYEAQEKKDQFSSINRFLQEVTGKRAALLEVTSDKEHLLVHMDNKVLPLEALGTGIHETVLIASYCTINQGKIICLEEPEIHLHPVLQRKLINYLADKTENQYFIATHSPSMIDYDGASIFRVENDGVQTFVRHVMSNDDRHHLLDELGYRASDILQTNFLIWVEGPSDRIYVNHWIAAKNANLVEGIDYSIMFYGGGLIKHISASESAVEEFINVLKINRNCAIIMDSDRTSARSHLKPNVQRIRDEMTGGNRFAWITKGREIENYIDYSKLQDALRECHSRVYVEGVGGGPYDHAFYFRRATVGKDGDDIHKDGDKVRAATIICQQEADFSVLDLDQQVKCLVGLIEKSNSS